MGGLRSYQLAVAVLDHGGPTAKRSCRMDVRFRAWIRSKLPDLAPFRPITRPGGEQGYVNHGFESLFFLGKVGGLQR